MSEEDLLRSVVSSAEFRGRVGSTDAFNKYRDVDLIFSAQGHEFRLPAADLSLVPHLLEHRSWEPHISRYLTRNLTSDDIFVDVGANLGFFTVLCAPLVSRVIAFEPVSLSHRYCKGNIALNQLTNVDLFQCGLWSEDTIAKIKADLDAKLSVLDAHLKAAVTSGQADRPYPPGAGKARDGLHYVDDPNRPGKYLMVVHHG